VLLSVATSVWGPCLWVINDVRSCEQDASEVASRLLILAWDIPRIRAVDLSTASYTCQGGFSVVSNLIRNVPIPQEKIKVRNAPSTANLLHAIFLDGASGNCVEPLTGSSAAPARALLPTSAARPRGPGKCIRSVVCLPSSSWARRWPYPGSSKRCLSGFW
jgi:hypothetical protein